MWQEFEKGLDMKGLPSMAKMAIDSQPEYLKGTPEEVKGFVKDKNLEEIGQVLNKMAATGLTPEELFKQYSEAPIVAQYVLQGVNPPRKSNFVGLSLPATEDSIDKLGF
jgi:hypothetical protein